MLLGSRRVCGGRGACAIEEPELVLCRGKRVGGLYVGLGGGLYRELELELARELGG